MSKSLTIIKVGGKVVEKEATLEQLLEAMQLLGGAKILVHGGGVMATEIASKMGLQSEFVEGRRVTNEEMLKVITMTYGGLINKNIVAKLQAKGVNSIGLTGADLNLISSKKRPVQDIDYGFVGDIEQVNIHALKSLIGDNVLPVLAPITHNKKGVLLNTNADNIAAAVARALSPYYTISLIYCFDKMGVLRDIHDNTSYIPKLQEKEYIELKKKGVVAEGMVPKLDTAFQVLQQGVKEVRITNIEGVITVKGTTLCH